MYLSYFGFAEAPFSIAPDPRFLYMTRGHQEALAHLLFGVNGDGGFVLLTGEIGAGKTTVCRCLLEQIPDTCDVAYIFNPKLTVEELLSTICTELRIEHPPGNTSIKVFVDCINAFLLDANARGRHTVLIIDEAQNLSAEVLEQMRLLTNLETNQRKLLQIILLGQPELLALLEHPAMRQLAQRIVARYHLGTLDRAEIAAYVAHRLQVAGCERQLLPDALAGRLHRLSGGVPRLINALCDRTLLGAYVQGKERIDRATLDQAAREVFGKRRAARRPLLGGLAALLAVTAGGAAALVAYQRSSQDAPPPAAAAAKPTTAAAAAGMQDRAHESDLPQAFAWSAGVARSQSRALAQAALFEAWGAKYAGGDVCREAGAIGLRCRSARGGLDELRHLNRPAVLQLHDEQGGEFFATLLRIDAKAATLTLGGETRSVALGALASQWSGHYTALWRAPAQAGDGIRPGQSGPAVAWLAGQLAQWQGRSLHGAAADRYDDALTRAVKQFQLAQGLTPDGIVGPQTLMRLSSVGDPAAPKLMREPAH